MTKSAGLQFRCSRRCISIGIKWNYYNRRITNLWTVIVIKFPGLPFRWLWQRISRAIKWNDYKLIIILWTVILIKSDGTQFRCLRRCFSIGLWINRDQHMAWDIFILLPRRASFLRRAKHYSGVNRDQREIGNTGFAFHCTYYISGR